MAVIGLAAGLVAAFWSSSLLKSMLFGVAASDLQAYAAAVLFILAIVTAAASVPAFRAVRTDPATALRYE
jgi:ABC-type antimicrobial peptide transport system permease subunit